MRTWSARSRPGIPEDDPRNPATIADNVGDNVGDCAGMASDLFESYEVTLVASIILGVPAFTAAGLNPALGLVFPLAARAIGVVASIAGVYAVRAKEGETNALKPINRGFFTAGVLTVIGVGALGARLREEPEASPTTAPTPSGSATSAGAASAPWSSASSSPRWSAASPRSSRPRTTVP